jgi:hypothetical protein
MIKVNALEWSWEGSKYAIQHIHTALLKEFKKPPWPIKVLGIQDFDREAVFVRTDVGLHLWWIVALIYYRLLYNIRNNPNGLINQGCFKIRAWWWKFSLKVFFKGNLPAFKEYYSKKYPKNRRSRGRK